MSALRSDARRFGKQLRMTAEVQAALLLGKHVHVYTPDGPWCSDGCDMSKPPRGFRGRHIELDDPLFGALAHDPERYVRRGA